MNNRFLFYFRKTFTIFVHRPKRNWTKSKARILLNYKSKIEKPKFC